MALFLVYSDIHFWNNWPEFNPLTSSGLNKRLEVQLDVWKQIEELAILHKVDAKLFSGDLFHKRSYFHTTVVNSVLDCFKKGKIAEFMISGNHDRWSPQFNAVQALDGINTAYVIPKEKSYFIEGDSFVIAGALPGGPVPKVTDIVSKPKILLAHGILNGSKAQSGFELSGGYNLEDFKGWDLCCLGDVHKKQVIGNVLIPGSTQQNDWGESDLECGCWLLSTEQPRLTSCDLDRPMQWQQVGTCWSKFLPLRSPKFIKVTQENFSKVIEKEFDDYNYYDFKLTQEIDKPYYKEVKKRFPNSYLSVSIRRVDKSKASSISQRKNTPKEILEKFYDLRVKGKHKEEFVDLGLEMLLQADPTQINTSHKNLEIEGIKAENFMCFEKVELDFTKLNRSLYQITGVSDEETSNTNGVGKSSLITEILTFCLYGTLARSANRSKDRLIHDPKHEGKVKGLFVEATIKIGDVRYKIQRYRKHSFGTGSRILREKVNGNG